jgi:hypothetical protein
MDFCIQSVLVATPDHNLWPTGLTLKTEGHLWGVAFGSFFLSLSFLPFSFLSFFLPSFLFFFLTGSCYVAQLALNWTSSCLRLPSSGITTIQPFVYF